MALHYTLSIDINAPIEKVIALFENPDNLKEWQPGFISLEHVSGEKGKSGSKSLLRYKMGNREMEMLETLLKNDLPDAFDATYQTSSALNTQWNKFEKVGESTTRWISASEFKLNGMMKLMGWLTPGAFKRQSRKFMELFKVFAENSLNEEGRRS